MEEAFFSALIKSTVGWFPSVWHRFFKKKSLSIDEIKRRTQILFVDDESFDDYLLTNIRQAGWNVRQLKDIHDLDSEEIRSATIIFMDYKGVGAALTPSEEGIGLMKALRHKYPNKHIIFYSGYAGFIPGHEVHGIANAWIQKNSDPYIYIERIEVAARTIYDR